MKSVSEWVLAASLGFLVLSMSASCGSTTPKQFNDEIASDGLRIRALRGAAIENGAARAADLIISTDAQKVEVGRLLFESPLMSLNGSISCRDCHLDEFGSTDGLPNAVGVGGEGKGKERLKTDGRILPRNVLPFWGRGGKGFDTFFWDGKVHSQDDRIISQFGDVPPSSDPLIVAIHLPSVELREMVADTPEVRDTLVVENVSAAEAIQSKLAKRFARDAEIGPMLDRAYGKQVNAITFAQIGDALAQFIRHEFRMRPTPFERFVFAGGPITTKQLAGGILFYGRGRCASCHNGPYFSDLRFHAVAFPQAGFGKNGFGIDEGRYNITYDPKDRFLFRTPPLHNVHLTAPYSHSGSVTTIQKAIIAHFDPLRLTRTDQMTVSERSDFYARLGPASQETLPSALTDEEVDHLVQFLAMLTFEHLKRQ